MEGKRILVVDDDQLLHEFLVETLRRAGYTVDGAETANDAIEKIKKNPYHLVITDLRLPDRNGLGVLQAAKKINPDMGVIVITAYGTVENAVEAMKVGAFDYLTKPFSADQIEMVVKKFFEYNSLKLENEMLRSQLGHLYGMESIIDRSPKMRRVFRIIRKVAGSRATVLIQGPSGTGKELVAKAIHYNSPRRDKPFVKTNCATLPEGLIESELFGHEKGAFTGAIKRTRGRFEMADGGTLLLDEISEMSLHLQAKLLRVLQEREFEKIGSGETVSVDVRVIATTNRDLKEMVEKGEFREDLYYRLNVVPIQLPPLKERKEDIPLLVEHFIRKYAEENQKPVRRISEEAMRMIMAYDWPGNVRELENTIQRAVVICDGEVITPQHFLTFPELPLGSFTADHWNGETKNLSEVEKKLILQVLQETGGNRTKSAEILGISVRTLRNKIREYREAGIPIPE
ncbi:MAG TPA: sigma-54-dependent Fis family transcriptional regulator [Bacteroidetes bacterium]|nr:sigma-54-dependent Fis family transcriptional regulator [Bacteroidota bacterium]